MTHLYVVNKVGAIAWNDTLVTEVGFLDVVDIAFDTGERSCGNKFSRVLTCFGSVWVYKKYLERVT